MSESRSEPRFQYEQECSRCGGTGIDPEMHDCACDCCDHGVESLYLTEVQAREYPNAKKVSS
jgi:hypothetical protein